MESIAQIKQVLIRCTPEQLPSMLQQYETDQRKGVQTLLQKFQKQYENYQQEQKRLQTMLHYERQAYQKGCMYVAGVDEVGRGPLAGPVVAAAVILPQNHTIPFVNDSKQISAKKRESLAEQIKKEAIAYAVGVVSHTRIDEINILQATYEAMKIAIQNLSIQPDFILADAVTIPHINIPQQGIIQGDAKSISIAAASIIAKVTRDDMMEQFSLQYPQYDFCSNKGYGSQKHIAAIAQYGLCDIHRRSFVKKIMEKQQQNTIKGAAGEAIAVREMKKMGYEILAQNYRSGNGEIDIIAKKHDVIVFTEVKRRFGRTYGEPIEAVEKQKQNNIIRTAQAYLLMQGWLDCDCRFDVAEVLEEQEQTYFRYTENAFWKEGDSVWE